MEVPGRQFSQQCCEGFDLTDPIISCRLEFYCGNTIVLDLNSRPLPNLRHLKLDVAVFAGVLEYISDLDSVVRWLSFQVAMCVASYGCAHTRPRTIGRFKETIRRTGAVWPGLRNGAGWINTFTEDALVQTFSAEGFILTETHVWHVGESSERIFVFSSVARRRETNVPRGYRYLS